MSYDILLSENGEVVKVNPHYDGSILVVGGNDEADISITNNYGQYFEIIDKSMDLHWLNGKSAGETIARLEWAVAALGIERYTGPYYVIKMEYAVDTRFTRFHHIDLEAPENAPLLQEGLKLGILYDTGGYWKSTPGNAGYMLNILLSWAKQHPNARWSVS